MKLIVHLVSGAVLLLAGFAWGRTGAQVPRVAGESPEPSVQGPPRYPPVEPVLPQPEKGITPGPTSPDPHEAEWAATRSILDVFLPLLSDEQLEEVVNITLVWDSHLQGVVLDHMFEVDDPAYFELIKGFRIEYSGFLFDRVHDAFESESHPSRRAELAQALGHLSWKPGSIPHIESILNGRDEFLIERMLLHFRVGRMSVEDPAPILGRLRALALTGTTVELRARAVASMSGDESEEGIRFLVERILSDPESEVRDRALWTIQVNTELREEFRLGILSSLYAAVTDPTRDLWFRRQLADKLTRYDFSGLRNLWTQKQKDVLRELRGQER